MAKGKKKSNPNSPTTQTPLHIITTRSNATTQDSSKSGAPESKAAPQPSTASVDPSHSQSILAAVLLLGHTTTSSTPNIANITALVQSLHSDLHVFLEADLDSRIGKITKPLIYQILLHFNPSTKHRFSSNKPVLYKAFKDDVLPLILPFQLPLPPAPMQTDQSMKDFNPLGQKTTQKMLHDAVLEKAPKTEIPSNARLDGLKLLYQAHVDPDLVIPGQTKYIQTPRVVRLENLKDEDMEDLRLALQAYAPKVFVHLIPMTHKVLVSIYMLFILEEEATPVHLVRGFHYSVLE